MLQRFSLAGEFADPALERRLLAAITARPAVYWEVLDILPAEALTECRRAFKELATAIEQGKPLPAVEEEPVQEPAAAARKLADLHQKRLLAGLAQKLLEDLRSETPPDELITSLEDSLTRVQQTARELRAGQLVTVSSLLPRLIDECRVRKEAVRKQGLSAVGMPTGVDKLDRLLGGFQLGLHLLAAEPGQGKTTFVLQVACHIARTGWPVLFVSFEETPSRLALKAICASAGLEAKRFADGYADPEELKRAATDHGSKLEALHFLEGTPRLTVLQVKAKALQVMNRLKRDRCLVVIDYLQRWAAGRRDFAEFRHTVSSLVTELRELALRLDSPVLVISSQNRPGQGTSHLTSLKESGDLEYSADTALFLVGSEKRPITPPARAVDLVIEKNRYGDRGMIELIFRPDIGVFREAKI